MAQWMLSEPASGAWRWVGRGSSQGKAMESYFLVCGQLAGLAREMSSDGAQAVCGGAPHGALGGKERL